jgi:hypothetical protein
MKVDYIEMVGIRYAVAGDRKLPFRFRVEKQMGIPARGDPRRPLYLAVRSTRVLGILFLLIGTFVSLLLSVRGGMPRRGGIFLTGGLLLFYVGPGVVYLITAIYLKRRQFWAVVVGLVLASIQSLFVLLGIAGILLTLMRQPAVSIALVPMGVMIFVLLALAQLIYHLSLSFEAIKYAPTEEQHGFEPLMATPPPPKENDAEK